MGNIKKNKEHKWNHNLLVYTFFCYFAFNFSVMDKNKTF